MKKLFALMAMAIFFVGVAAAQTDTPSTSNGTSTEVKKECTQKKECCSKGAQTGEKKECCSKEAKAGETKGSCEHKEGEHKAGEHKGECTGDHKSGEKKECCSKGDKKKGKSCCQEKKK